MDYFLLQGAKPDSGCLKIDQADRSTACRVRPLVNCAVELISGLELITSFRLLHFYFSSDF